LPDARGDAGFTLIETLFATAITLVVLGAAITALANAVSLGDKTRRVTDTNQGLQAALALMVRDCIQTGHGIPAGGVPLPGGDGSVGVIRPGPPGGAIMFPAAWATLPAVAPGAALGPNVRGQATDMLTLLYADPTLDLSQWPLASLANDGSQMTVDARTDVTGADGLRVGDVIMFSNAAGNALQMVTSVDGQTAEFAAGDPLQLNQRGADTGSVLALRTGASFPPTTATRVVMVSYYIDAVTDPAWPRLVRQVNGGVRAAIALGVENLQVSFDLVDGETNPANVKSPADDNSANQIRKVNLFIAGRSQDEDPDTRAFYRNAVATEVSLRSLSFVDRYR
jgi:type II secretory pathway pseudopilin PulG